MMFVLDANILMRAVLGKHARSLIAQYVDHVEFIAPQFAFDEARNHLPEIIERRKLLPKPLFDYLDSLQEVVQVIEPDSYAGFESIARRRLSHRHENAWPILATALALGCPIWTEDTDFFGCGVATWTTDRVELYMAEFQS